MILKPRLLSGILHKMGEYQDGYTIVDRKSVRITGAEARERNLRDDFLILAPQLSVYIAIQATDGTINNVYQSLRQEGRITEALLKATGRYRT